MQNFQTAHIEIDINGGSHAEMEWSDQEASVANQIQESQYFQANKWRIASGFNYAARKWSNTSSNSNDFKKLGALAYSWKNNKKSRTLINSYSYTHH